MTTTPPSPPTGWRRSFFRMPLWLYRHGLGGMLGARYVLLTHTGRVSGEPRQALLEVVDRDPATGALIVVAGFGPRTDWYRNVQVHPDVTIQVGRDVRPARAAVLTPDEAADVMAVFAPQHPATARRIARSVGLGTATEGTATSDARWRAVGERTLFVRLSPR